MEYKKLFILSFLSVFCLSGVFSASFADKNTELTFSWYLPSIQEIPDSNLAQSGIQNSFSSQNYFWTSLSEDYRIFSESVNNIIITDTDFTLGGVSKGLQYLKYQSSDFSSDIKCVPTISNFNPQTFTAEISSNLKPLNQNPSTTSTPNLQSIFDFGTDGQNAIKNNYYMKTLVAFVVKLGSTGNNIMFSPVSSNVESRGYVYNKNEYNVYNFITASEDSIHMLIKSVYSDYDGEKVRCESSSSCSSTGSYYKYLLVEPTAKTIQFDKNQILEYINSNCNLPDTCTYKIIVMPIDGKCDMNNDGSFGEYFSAITSLSVSLPITPQDPILDSNGGTILNPITNTNKDGLCSIESGKFLPKLTTFTNSTGHLVFLDEQCNKIPITNPVDENRVIEIYKESVLVKQEPINVTKIALLLPSLKSDKNEVEFKKSLDNSYDIMTDLNITKQLFYNEITNKTTIKIQLKNTAGKKNLTIYEIVPKTMAQDVTDITLPQNPNAKLFIKDADPVIGWYINDSTGNEELEYGVGGNQSDPGYIVITQEPILFNEGNLIINYRQLGCRVDEVPLFSIDSISNSNVSLPTSTKPYTICARHLDYELKTTGTNELEIGSFEQGGNISINLSKFPNKIKIAVDNNAVYWDLKIQETNPAGDYSCLGSINNQITSTFGDCSYSPQNRIWIHLGADLVNPQVSVIVPPLSHTLKVTIIAQDNIGGSGIDSLKYCVDDTNTCTPTNLNIIQVDKKITSEVSISCGSDSGCTKYIKYEAKDVAGNIFTGSKPIVLIDKGSSCQSDCTAKPKPNRFINECRGVNNCKYYPYDNESNYDNGEFVADACHLHTIGSYVPYNTTHDILCPYGPFRATTFTSLKLRISSDCYQLISTQYPVIINGRTVTLSVYTCIN